MRIKVNYSPTQLLELLTADLERILSKPARGLELSALDDDDQELDYFCGIEVEIEIVNEGEKILIPQLIQSEN